MNSSPHTGLIGAGVTGTSGAAAWFAKTLPILQGVSLTVSILVGITTLAWYATRKWRS